MIIHQSWLLLTCNNGVNSDCTRTRLPTKISPGPGCLEEIASIAIRPPIIHFFSVVFVEVCVCWSDFSECHDDFVLKPPDGVLKQEHSSFNWLGFLRYLHVELGTHHPTLAPRVVLVHRQFVLATAKHVTELPTNYQLGYIVFGQYERDEVDCNLKQSQANMGITCGPAYIDIPHSQIVTHPEYSRFGVGNSLSLLKLIRPLKSHYMIPVCLPTRTERERQNKLKSVIMIDYTSQVPEDFNEERMAKKTLKLFTRRECDGHTRNPTLDTKEVTHYLCTSGCGMRPGAPIIHHSSSGPFELLGMVFSSCYCTDRSMRSSFNKDPPLYIDIYQYVTWIRNVITAHIIPHPYPSKSLSPEALNGRRLMYAGREIGTLRERVKQREGWVGRIYKVGNYCYKRRSTQRTLTPFYIESFEVLSGNTARLRVFIRISAGVECTIVCARIALPNSLTRPKVNGIGGYNITIEFKTDWFPFHFYFNVGLVGKLTSKEDLVVFLQERPQPGYWYKDDSKDKT